MGYTTDFKGAIYLSRELTEDEALYIRKFSETRRMKRCAKICENYLDPFREAVGLPIGEDGEFTVFSIGFMGQNPDSSVIDHNKPPKTQPELWMHWTVGDDNKSLVWNECEKFHSYFEWLKYIHDQILIKWNVTFLSSTLKYYGESRKDKGSILFDDGKIIKKNKYDENDIEIYTLLSLEP